MPPAPEVSEGWQLGKPDLVISLPEPYFLKAGGNADSWPRFLLPVPISGTHYVKGVEIDPGNPRAVHHCYIVIDRSQTLHFANGEVYETGSFGMENQVASGAAELDSRFLTWRPGTLPFFEPEGATWRLDKNTDLTLTMHLLPSGKTEEIQPKVALYFSDQPPTKFPMLLHLEHDSDIDIPPGVKDYPVADDLVLPTDVKVLALLPHAHYLCREMQAFATLPDGTRQWLIRIERWNFDWQGVFRYLTPISLPKGSTLSMRYTYDNTAGNPLNPHNPPRRVFGGPKSTDEMADLWLEVLPDRREDLFELEIALMRHRLEKYPHDVEGFAELGNALRAKGKNQEALGALSQAALLAPDNVQVQNNLGTVLGSLGNLDEAVTHFREAVRLRPDYFVACFNLANALRKRGDLKEATVYYGQAARLRPESVEAHNRLGLAYAQQGNFAAAVVQFQNALRLNPHDSFAQEGLAGAQSALGTGN